ncbi:MAG TPA: carboxypeptidase-like regulatory domain-containing protein, partial [Polyangiaceae bacterium]|nr:carboxypeptidase-like regulatory domain-containing protein [Polyangiaceae bacterium]
MSAQPALALVGCNSESPSERTPTNTGTDAGGGSAIDASATDPSARDASADQGNTVIVGPGVDSAVDAPMCTSCTPQGGQYCGEIGNVCGGKLQCGNCAADSTCQGGLCVGGPSCPRGACQTAGAQLCGTIGDGCGGSLACGSCPVDQTCKDGVCVRVGCVPLMCMIQGATFCGVIGDGCGGTLNCGDCANGGVCGGAIRNVCGAGPGCVKATCTPTGGTYCGTIGDGCGGTLDCGSCAAGESCNAGGLCVKNGCMPASCDTPGARFCGTIGDGCGASISCPACPTGQVCGSVRPNICTVANCVPISCTPPGGGQYCGRIGDGCAGVLDCPTTCPNGAACGSAGVANACPGWPSDGGACTGLGCQVDKCVGRPKTTIKGTVYDPGGKLPLYNVMVYVPNGPLDPIVEGVSCQKCDTTASGRPVASALTDAAGNFTMQDVPVGANIPVVIQSGKWRRQITLPMVPACQDNVFTGPDVFRLPKNQAEGHLPKIAMTRGGADSLECVLRRIGIDAAEFTNPTDQGRINIFWETGEGTAYDNGAAFPPVSTLFDAAVIRNYDMVVISCHGESARSRAQPLAEKQIVKGFVDQGGRVFGSHFSFGY